MVTVKEAACIAIIFCKLHDFSIDETKYTAVPRNNPDDIRDGLMKLYAQDKFVQASSLYALVLGVQLQVALATISNRRRRDLERSSTREHFTEMTEEMGMRSPE